jgi:hypothetical protein
MFLFIQSNALVMLKDWGDVVTAGDDVAVPALGQSNFLAGFPIYSYILNDLV